MVLDPRRLKPAYIAYAHDIVMAAISFALSLYLRLGAELFEKSVDWLLVGTILFTVVCAAAFWFMRLYRGIWRYASLNDLLAITRAVTLAILVFLVLMFLWTRLEQVPRSLPFINWFVLIALLGGPRFLYRLIKDRRFVLSLENGGQRRIPVLLVGAGDAAELFIRATSRSGGADYQVVGIVAEQPANVGRHIHGIEVLGTTEGLTAVVKELDARGDRPQRLILTKDDMDGAKVRTLLDGATEAGMTMARLPKLTDFKSGISDKMEIRPVAVEDLLGRPQTTLDRSALSTFIKGRRILITGAGGSIGAELVRQISDLAPAELILLDNSEFNLYSVELALAESHPALERHAIIGDVRDRERIGGLFAAFRPELVFHAAALKHVPLVETNPFEGVATNVTGTVNVADACVEAGVAAMVMISTDKAVNPTSVMGATKRIAEQYCQALDLVRRGTDGTRFITVRFGNVLGSTGSVVPLFQRQLAQGGPLTVTDPDMKRYFMTVSEAVALVLQASAHGSRDAEHGGKIFVLDMGEPVRILDLARQLIRLAGLRPDDDIKIEIIGPRPGEKFSEETFHGGEIPVPTETKGVLLAAPRPGDHRELSRTLGLLAEACARSDADKVIEILHELVPEYQGAPENPARASA